MKLRTARKKNISRCHCVTFCGIETQKFACQKHLEQLLLSHVSTGEYGTPEHVTNFIVRAFQSFEYVLSELTSLDQCWAQQQNFAIQICCVQNKCSQNARELQTGNSVITSAWCSSLCVAFLCSGLFDKTTGFVFFLRRRTFAKML